MTDKEFEEAQNLRVEMLDSLMELMQKARLSKDMVMWDSCSRLVYETWQAIAEEEEKHNERKENTND